MSITVEEKALSRSISRGNNRSAVIGYIVRGTNSDVAAANAVATFLDTNDLLVWDTDIPFGNMQLDQIAPEIWDVKVNYGFTNDTSVNQVSFDTAGGTQKITQSAVGMAFTTYVKSGEPVPDFKGAINVDDNSVNGVDITVPAFSWTDTRYYLSMPNQANLYALTGKVNNAGWNGYNQGEVLFMGASGSRRGFGIIEIQYKFSANPNRTGIQIGTITGIAKKGWEYLWVRYEKDTSNGVLVQTPVSVHVHQVYEYGNFALLGF